MVLSLCLQHVCPHCLELLGVSRTLGAWDACSDAGGCLHPRTNHSASSHSHCHRLEQVLLLHHHLSSSPSILSVGKEGEKPVSFSVTCHFGLHGPPGPVLAGASQQLCQSKANGASPAPSQGCAPYWSLWFLICASLERASSHTLAHSPQGSTSLDHQRFYNN